MATTRAIKTVTIDAKKWIRGDGHSTSSLHRSSDGMQCCLGFACEAFGVTKRAMSDRGELQQVRGLPRALRFSHDFGLDDKASIWGVYGTNDRGLLPDEERVHAINNILDAMKARFRFRLKTVGSGTKATKAKRARATRRSAAQK